MNQDIEMAFSRENIEKIWKGQKWSTFRRLRYGEVGDRLVYTIGLKYGYATVYLPITSQVKTKIGLVATHCHLAEGYATETEFIAGYLKLMGDYAARHRRPPPAWNPDKVGWLHWFKSKPMPKRLWRKLVIDKTLVSTTMQMKLLD